MAVVGGFGAGEGEVGDGGSSGGGGPVLWGGGGSGVVRGVRSSDSVSAGFRPGAVAVEYGAVAVPGGMFEVRPSAVVVVPPVSGERAWFGVSCRFRIMLNYEPGIMGTISQSGQQGRGRRRNGCV